MGGFQGVVVFADTLAAVDGGVGGGVDGADPVAVVGAEHIGEWVCGMDVGWEWDGRDEREEGCMYGGMVW